MHYNPPMPDPIPATPLPGFPREISREEMATLPVRKYEGDVLLVESARDMDRAWEDLARESMVGWDTETRPAFRVGESYLPSLVQAATARAVYIFPVSRMDFSAVLGGLFAEPTIVKPGISIADDLAKLKQVIPFEEASVLDLGHVAKRRGLKQTGLRNLSGIFLGWRIVKGAKTTNWAAPRLTSQQINYAATDAWACRELYLKFRELGMV